MTLLWFLLGIILIFLISRYNESNRLFWILFASFVGAFTVASVVLNSTKHDTKSKVDLVQMCPMQAPSSTLSLTMPVTDVSDMVTEVVPATAPVGKDCTFAPNKILFAFSEDGVKIFDKPPQMYELC